MSKDKIFFLIITTAVALIWVAASIYHSQAEVAISPKIKEALDPINPTFDTATFGEIDKRLSSDRQPDAAVSSRRINATPTPRPVATRSATPRPTTKPATGSGTLNQ